ncbi:MAG TPA: tripartite tricarboxylate transporter permease [Candidatus Ozemobacteraceae bacterium]|nr:tripartite tricarboxylate transporter permease [Candidatus Ozemobacteraceae bacterium]
MEFFTILGYTLLGTLVGAVFSLFPSLHIYNVAGIVLVLWTYLGDSMQHAAVGPFFISMITAFAFINTIPMTFFGAPDESAQVTILPNTIYFMNGKGYEAAVIQGLGALIGVFLMIALTPLFYYVLPYVDVVLSAHMHWIILLIVVYLVLSEWPKGCGFGTTRLDRFSEAMGNVFAGLFTWVVSGILGIIILSKSIITHEMGFQNIMPVFVGLFAIPSILQNLVSTRQVPKQHICTDIDVTANDIGKSAFVGTVSGAICGYVPAITAGIGSIIASHATAMGFSARGDVLFILGGAITKFLYYVGAFLLIFVVTPLTPAGVGKGGLNIILRPIFTAEPGDYLMGISVILVAGGISFFLLLWLSRWVLSWVADVDYHDLYWAAFVAITALVAALTGFPGLFTMLVGTAIGCVPVFFHARRSNCMGVLLIPICLNMAGYGDQVAALFGLL